MQSIMPCFDKKTFLLPTKTARLLYTDYAAEQPIFDFHCHLSPQDIWEDKPFENISRIWLGGDHYKWRAMRAAGVEETLITGDGDDAAKFEAFAAVCETLCGSPVHHWAQMELSAYFDIEQPLNRRTAAGIYQQANELIRERGYSPRKMIQLSGVQCLATTDDPVSDLQWHEKLMQLSMRKNSGFGCRVLPAFRPDNALKIHEEGFADWVARLGRAAGVSIRCYADLLDALRQRLTYFAEFDTHISDQVIEYTGYIEVDERTADAAFRKRLAGDALNENERLGYFWRLLYDLARLYAENRFVMQLHIGAARNVNSRMLRAVGRDAGFDIMWDASSAPALLRFFDRLDSEGALPKVILYPLNGKDFEVYAAIAASFPQQGVAGRMQLGSAWWHNDHKEGIYAQLTAIAQQNLLAPFVGMLTDSRSFLSYARHDYFRRILCSFIADRMDSGEYICTKATVAQLIGNICFRNAVKFFE